MRWAGLAAGALLLALPSPASAAEEAAPRVRPGVRVEPFPDGRRLDVVLPGSLIAYALPSDADGRREVMFLIEPRTFPEKEAEEPGKRPKKPREAGPAKPPPCPAEPAASPPRALFRLDRGGAELIPIREDLPGDATGLEALDLDGDGAEELVLIRPGEFLRAGEEASSVLAQVDGLRWRHLHPAVVREPELGAAGLLPSVRGGMLTLYGASGGVVTPVATAGLPIESSLQGRTLTLRHAVPRFLGLRGVSIEGAEDRAGGALFVTGSDGTGDRRLRTLLVELLPGGENVSMEAWAALPGPEEVLERHFLILDGEPVLLVATRPGDRLALFGEKRLRIFPLRTDRSRLGFDPIFAAESKMNLWQDSVAVLADVSQDGLEDLVIGYWTGLVDASVAIDVYLREADGTFRTSPRTTSFDVPEADRDFLEYGADLDGDGLGDLLVLSDRDVLSYPGLPSRNGKKIVDWRYFAVPLGTGGGGGRQDLEFNVSRDPQDPPWRMPRAVGAPRIVDLDGDGVSEVILVQRGGRESPGTFRIVSFAR